MPAKILEQNLSAGLLYGALPKIRRRVPQHEDDVAGKPVGNRQWIEGDLAVWQPDPTQGTVDVLVRAVDEPAGIAEVLVLTPHIEETGQELVAPLSELDVKGRRDVLPRADFEVGDEAVWTTAGRVVSCTIAASPHPDFDWITVEVDEEEAAGVLKAGRYNPHRGSIRPRL